jgi:hypothetical protein
MDNLINLIINKIIGNQEDIKIFMSSLNHFFLFEILQIFDYLFE